MHFAAGAGISLCSYYFAYKLSKNKNTAFWFGLSSGVLAGMAKEIWDAQGNGNPEVNDAIASSIGTFVPVISLNIFLKNPRSKENTDRH